MAFWSHTSYTGKFREKGQTIFTVGPEQQTKGDSDPKAQIDATNAVVFVKRGAWLAVWRQVSREPGGGKPVLGRQPIHALHERYLLTEMYVRRDLMSPSPGAILP